MIPLDGWRRRLIFQFGAGVAFGAANGGGAVVSAGIGRLPGFLFLSPIPFAGRQAGLLLMTRIF